MASTYVNDLRLNEMATGDQSGSWGTVTNTNLELIAEAFSYGTEAITTNADTHTTTIADGATDPGRSMFLKYTGTLDSACTITIGPNTVSKLWFIENATSGSQNIIIKQGSGATVTIASGKTKVIYSDGVGSAAKMVDAFDSLSVGALSGTTGTFSGAVAGASATFDGGVDIDNINIDGTTIALSSGDLTLDAAGKIILDGDEAGATVHLKDGGVHWGSIYRSSSNFNIKSETQDKDIIFLGNDGGSTITALTLDMSDAGTAIFNHDIKLGDNGQVKFGDATDLRIYHDGTHSYISEEGTGDLYIRGAGSVRITSPTSNDQMALFQDGGEAQLNHNGSLKLQTKSTGIQVTGDIANSSGNLTLDVAGEIVLDADTNGVVRINDAGSNFGAFFKNGTTFTLKSEISDYDMVFSGNDGGATINALTLDMSAAGAATFNGDVNAPNFNTTSDATLKTNVETLTGSLDAVKSLRGVSFDWLENGGSEIGVIAQEVEDVLPDVVNTNEDGIKSVKYGNMVAVLIEAMKEQQAQIDELKEQINS